MASIAASSDAPAAALRRAVILGTVTFVTILYTMTVMIANVALPKMQGTFAATPNEIALVVTFNIVATAVVTPISGWLASRFSRRALMVFCATGFTIASVFCGTAASLDQLVFFRILQGGFGAPLVPLCMTMVMDTFPREQQGTAMSIFGMGVVFGPIIGPTVGGYLSEELGWRWVFFMLVPFGVVAVMLVLAFIDDRRKAERMRLDWTGFLLLAVAVAALQLMMDRGQRLDWFDSTEILIEAVVALAAFYLFLAHTFTTRAPFLQVALFRDHNLVIGLLISFLFGAILWTPLVLYPPMLAQMQGYPEDLIGLYLALRGLGTLLGSTTMAVINRHFDPRLLLACGFLLQAAGGLFMAGFDVNLQPFALAWTNALAGFGVGWVWVPLTLLTFATLDKRHLNDGSAYFHLIRNIGSSISISLSIVLVVRTTSMNYADLASFVTIFGDSNTLMALKGAVPTGGAPELQRLSGEITRQSQMIGYINAFYLYAALALLVLPLIALMRLPPGEEAGAAD